VISPPAAPTLSPAEILDRVRVHAGSAWQAGRVDRGDAIAEVAAGAIPALARAIRDDQALRFDQLVDLTAVHWPHDGGREFELVYQWRSVRHNLFVRIKTRLADGAPAASLAVEFGSADFLEREVYDLMGVPFAGHPNLRRILLPEGYAGHPLRKDYPVEGPNFPEDARRNDLFGRLEPDGFWAGVREQGAS